MKFIKWLSLFSLLVVSTGSMAGDITATEIMDNYIGKGRSTDVYGNVDQFDVDKMSVERTGTTLSVDIYTSFYDDIGSYMLGDLFMAVSHDGTTPWNPTGDAPYTNDRYSRNDLNRAWKNNNTGTNWNYAYTLGGDRGNYFGDGQLVSGFDNNDLKLSNQYHGRYSRKFQAISVNSYDNVHGSSSDWGVASNKSYTKNGIDYGKISFSFDVAGTALATANQIAFRWAMSCANDIVEGLVPTNTTPGVPGQPGDPTKVPEPATVFIMLLALAGVAYSRRKQGDSFSV